MKEINNINIALLGLGTVGTGVYKVLERQKEEMLKKIGAKLTIKKILIRNMEKAASKVRDVSLLKGELAEIVVITDMVQERHFNDSLAVFRGMSIIREISAVIRVYSRDQ